MPNRSYILRFVLTCLLLGASVVAAQGTSPNEASRRPQLPHEPAGARAFEKPRQPLVGYVRIGKFQLLNSSTGWAEGGYERLLWTTDGGAHWKDISPPNPYHDPYADVFFLDQVTGWVLFSHHIWEEDDPLPDDNPNSDWTFYLAATQDGGKTWTTIQIPALLRGDGSNLDGDGQLAFGDRLNGWIMLGHSQTFADLLHSTDGGLHWEWVESYPEDAGEIRAVGADRLFVNGIGGDENELLGTWDGGRTFQALSVPPPPAAGKAGLPFYDSPRFADPQNGYETVTFTGDVGVPSVTVLYRTTDGGHTWKSVGTFADPDGTHGISSTVMDSSWVIGFKHYKGQLSLIKLPLPSGETYAPAHHVGDFSICKLSFWGSSAGWAGCDAPLVSTEDGGTTWTVINPKAIEGTGKLTDLPVTPPPPSNPPPHPITVPNFEPVPQRQPPTALIAAPTGSLLPSGLSQQLAFDTVLAPSTDFMSAWWAASPYYDVLVYLKSYNRLDANFTPSWISAVQGQGWGLIPMWVGPQPPCNGRKHKLFTFSSDPATANAQGIAEADDAYSGKMTYPGYRKFDGIMHYGFDGSVVYLDIEGYTSADCGQAVQAYVEGFVSELRYVWGVKNVGVYASISNVPDIASSCYTPPQGAQSCDPPDDIFFAHYDGRATEWNLGYGKYANDLTNSEWPLNERVHQYERPHDETWGGAEVNIDTDIVDSTIVAGDPSIKPLLLNDTPTMISDYDESDPVIVTGIADGTNNSSSADGPFTQGNVAAYDVYGSAPLQGTWASGQVAFQALPLPTPSPSSPCRISNAEYFVYTTGINDQGTVVGYITPPMDGPIQTEESGTAVPEAAGSTYDCDTDGIIWPGPGEVGYPGPVIYKDPYAQSTELYSINDAGWITGSIIDNSGNYQCILVEPDAKGRYRGVIPIEFSELGGDCESADVNGIGQIVGNSDAGAFYEDVEGGTPGENGVPVSGNPSIYGINNNGFVVTPGFIESLFTPAGYNFPSSVTAYGLNDDPEVVGDDWSGTNPQGVLYDIVH